VALLHLPTVPRRRRHKKRELAGVIRCISTYGVLCEAGFSPTRHYWLVFSALTALSHEEEMVAMVEKLIQREELLPER
jgi:hypothetical protein